MGWAETIRRRGFQRSLWDECRRGCQLTGLSGAPSGSSDLMPKTVSYVQDGVVPPPAVP